MAKESKKSFVLYYDYRNHLALLSDEERGRLLMALFDYAEKGKEPELDGAALMAFSFVRAQMDRDMAKYAETVKKRQEAGRQGGRPPKASESNEKQEEAKKANGFSEKQTEAKKPDNDNVNVTDNVTDTDIYTPLPPKGETPPDAQERRFGEFWAEYPKKVGKKAALTAWKRLKPDAELFERIMQAVTSAKNSEQWNREGGRYIPNPTTWINQGRWDDEMQPKDEQSNKGSFDTDDFFEAALKRSYAGSNSPRAELEREAIKRSEENAKNPPKTAGNDEAIRAKMEALKERLG